MVKNGVKYNSITQEESEKFCKNFKRILIIETIIRREGVVMEPENSIKISILLEIYGELLTEKQYHLLNDYYNNDLSLAEIAENEEITRQAVRDNLKKGERKLFNFEEKLGIMKKNKMQEEQIADILSEINTLTENSTDNEVASVLEDVKNKLNCLV